jgi:hypothetical protein
VLEWVSGKARRADAKQAPQISPYETLGVEATASPETIRRAYIELIRIWHPDRFPDDLALRREAEGITKRINEAYEMLYPAKRARIRIASPSRRDRPPTARPRDHRSYAYASSAWESLTSTRDVAVIVIVLLIWLLASWLVFYALDQWT